MLLNFKDKYIEDKDYINNMIESYMPLIIKSITSVTGRYVSVENDEEFSIALMAFLEAMERYDEGKGEFSSFVKLVITSRVKNFLLKESKHINKTSIEQLTESGLDISEYFLNPTEDKSELVDEINKFKKELLSFGLTLEELVKESPKHEDTRRNAIKTSKKISKDDSITTIMFNKKRLPIRRISLKYNITERVLKRSKKFIISVVIIYFKNYRNLKLWIKNRGH